MPILDFAARDVSLIGHWIYVTGIVMTANMYQLDMLDTQCLVCNLAVHSLWSDDDSKPAKSLCSKHYKTTRRIPKLLKEMRKQRRQSLRQVTKTELAKFSAPRLIKIDIVPDGDEMIHDVTLERVLM
jgi:hypothetical protein